MENLADKVQGWALQGWEIAQGWLTSPAAWSQFGLLVVAWLAAVVAAKRLAPMLEKIISPPAEQAHAIAQARRFVLMFLPLLLPLLAYGFTAIGEQVTRSLFGSGAVIAFGKRVFLFIAARILVRDIVTEPFLRLLGRYVLLPVAGLYALGILDLVTAWLGGLTVSMGNISFSVLALLRGVIAGAVLFWLGRWSNDQSAAYIGKRGPPRSPFSARPSCS